MPNLRRTGSERRFTGWHMLAVMVGGFSVVIAVNLVLAVLATQTWTGLVVPNSYVASQHYNKALAKAKTQAERGWTGELEHSEGELRFTLTDRAGKSLPSFEVATLVRRPTHEGEDQRFQLSEIGPGLYYSPVNLAPGIWNVDLLARGPDGGLYREVYRLFVRKDE